MKSYAPRRQRAIQTAFFSVFLTASAASAAPSVMLLIDEKNLGTIPTSEVEALAVHALLGEDVKVVDQDMVRANIKKDQQLLKMAGDNRAAASLGLEFGADIVVVGEAVAKPSARRIAESNLRTYEAVVTLRAIQTDTSETIASASETASVIGLEDVSGGSKSLKAAGQKSLDALVPDMLKAWHRNTGAGVEPGKVQLTFGGVDQLWKLKAIRQMLKGRDDLVRSVRQNSYTAGAAVFEVEAQVAAEELSEEMVLDPPKGLKLQVLEVSSSKINLRAVAK